MKTSCNRNLLLEALTAADRTADRRQRNFMEGCVHLKAEQGTVEVTAANLQQTVTCVIPALVETEGEAAVPAVIFKELTEQLPSDSRVDLDTGEDAGILSVRCGGSASNIIGPAERKYPETARHAEEGAVLKIDPRRLKAAAAGVLPVIGSDADRPALQSMLLKAEGNEFVLGATDGYRMAVDGDELEEGTPEPVEVLLPAAAAKELPRLLADADGSVQAVIQPEGNRATFSFLNEATRYKTRYTTELKRDNFPDLLSFIPKTCRAKAVIDREQAIQATRAAHIFARENSGAAKLIVPEEAGKEIRLKAKSPENGEVEISLPMSRLEGQGDKAAFKSKFIADALSAVAGGELVMETNGPERPGVFRDPARSRYVSVVMPMFIQWDDDDGPRAEEDYRDGDEKRPEYDEATEPRGESADAAESSGGGQEPAGQEPDTEPESEPETEPETESEPEPEPEREPAMSAA